MPVSLEGIKEAVRGALARSKDGETEEKTSVTRAMIRHGVRRLGKRGDLNRNKHHVAQTHMGMEKPPVDKFMGLKASKRVEQACVPKAGGV